MATARVVKDISFTTNLVITTRHSEGTVIQSNIITCSLPSRWAPVSVVNSDRIKCQVKWKYTNIYCTELSTLPLGTTQSLWQLLRKRGDSGMECTNTKSAREACFSGVCRCWRAEVAGGRVGKAHHLLLNLKRLRRNGAVKLSIVILTYC